MKKSSTYGLIFFKKNDWLTRDEKRYGIDFYKKNNIDVLVIIDKQFSPKENYVVKGFDSEKVKKFLKKYKKVFVTTNCNRFYSSFNFLLFLKKHKLKWFVQEQGTIPESIDSKSYLRKTKNVINKLLNRIIFNFFLLPPPSIFFFSTASGKNIYDYKVAKKQIQIPSFDIDSFYETIQNKDSNLIDNESLKLSALNLDNFAVFVDEGGDKHPDSEMLKSYYGFSSRYYYEYLEKDLLKISKILDKEILIASHPRISNKNNLYLKKFKKFSGITNKLIELSNLVILHKSTAINFAVLHKKPVLFLRGYSAHKMYNHYQEELANLFNVNVIENLSQKMEKKDIESFISQKNNHENYKESFMCFNKKHKTSYQIIYEEIFK